MLEIALRRVWACQSAPLTVSWKSAELF